MSEADQVLTIDIVSDVVCPWCYVGEKRLEEALADEAGPVVVRWRPYQLDPTIPEGGLEALKESPEQFRARMLRDHERFRDIVKTAGLKPE